jgi:hypothetical protein
MSAITIRIPDSLHQNLKRLAQSDGISANQFIASAAAEKMASMMTLEFLRSEGALANRSEFEHFLSAVPDTPPTLDSDSLTAPRTAIAP